LQPEKARTYLASLFAGLSRSQKAHPDSDFETLRDEFSTLGGINEQGFRIFRSEGGSEAVRRALDAIHARVTGSAAAPDIRVRSD
jgi:pyrroline-5-carboxylate reductase